MQVSGSGTPPGAEVTAAVKWYDPVKGFGFLAPVDGSRDVFCHASAVGRAGWLTLPEGAIVTCEVVEGRQGPQVWRIHAVDASTASSGETGSGGPARGAHGPASVEQAPPPGRRLTAIVKWFSPAKGFGFLTPVDGSEDVFCHLSAVERAGYETLPDGASVICEVAEDRRGPAVSSIIAVETANVPPLPGHGAREYGRDDGHGGLEEERRGTVKFYNAEKGYGFVVPDDGGRDVFLHGSVLGRAGLGPPEPGQRVSVLVTQDKRGLQATDIELL